MTVRSDWINATIFLWLASFVLVVGASGQKRFKPGCDLHPLLADIAESQPIDKTCSIDGLSKEPDKVAESNVKNNFCVTGDATPIEYDTLLELQKAIDDENFPLGNRFHPARPTKKFKTKLGALGEGDLVSMAVWVLRAKNSNTSNGENVNCSVSGKDNNDVHIVLAKLVSHASLDDDECHSVTAEAIPHLRPSAWTAININSFRDHPFRFTGPLFLDSDHTPCRPDGTGGGPDRASVWEIHPLYSIEVCKFTTAAKCSVDSKSAWTPLDQWVDGESNQ